VLITFLGYLQLFILKPTDSLIIIRFVHPTDSKIGILLNLERVCDLEPTL
jgi:hypothetical protein